MSFISENDSKFSEKIYLSDNSWLIIKYNFYKLKKDDFINLWNLKPIDDIYIKFYGKTFPVPRKTALYSNENISYKFSGTTVKSKSFDNNSIIGNIINTFNNNINEIDNTISINKDIGNYYNAAFFNWYENGNNYISAHSDDEKDLNIKMGIWSLSFGFPRKFVITDKFTNKRIKTILLEDGMLIGMCGNFQQEFKHQITKQKHADKRINITIRSFK